MHPILRLMQYARVYRFRMIIAGICTALSTIFDMLPDLLIGTAVDAVIKKDNSVLASFGIIQVHYQLLFLGVVALFIWVCEAIFEYAYVYLWRTTAQTIQHKVRLDAYKHIQQLEMSYHEKVTTGGIVAILNDDVNQLERFLDVGAYKLIYLATTTLVVCSVFAYFAPTLVIFALVPAPLIVFIVMRFKKLLAPRYAAVRDRVAAIAHRVTQNIIGIVMIKSYTGEEHELKRLGSDSKGYQEANRAAIVLSAAFLPTVRMVIVIAFIMTVVFGGFRVLDGLLDVGAYSILVFQTQRLLWPATELAELIDLYERAIASAQRIFGLLDTQPHKKGATASFAPLHNVSGSIIFDHVTFSYDQSTLLFNNLSFAIKPGTTVAFVGPTGSGKSSLMKLLLRFYDATSGTIYLDHRDITTINPRDLRASIALVSQDIFLFDGSLRENISYGSFDASDEAIMRAARIAQAHDFIMALPQGYDTFIGERGLTLSGGQRQRISIARAVLKNPQIFILDEATASVDNQTEAALLQSLSTVTVGRTVIMIAHRLSTIYMADTIFVIDKGTVVQAGTHAELLAVDGMYAHLWQLQTGGMGNPHHTSRKASYGKPFSSRR